MNPNLLQTIFTVISGFLAVATAFLLKNGCVQDAAGQLSCTASSMPTWLAPYASIVVSVLLLWKLLQGFFEGKLTKPTVVVDPTKKV